MASKAGKVSVKSLPEGYRIAYCICDCGCQFANTYDLAQHKRKVCRKNEVRLDKLDDLPWVPFRDNKNGEWIFGERAPFLRDYIRNGNNREIGMHRYWLYGSNKFIARSRL